MEKESKYYIPEATELHIGYQCEIYHHYVGGSPYWSQIILEKKEIETEIGLTYEVLDIGDDYRTKYLDTQDIESLGWTGHEQITERTHRWQRNGNVLIYNKETKRLRIGVGEQQVYDGTCPSINELRRIMQLLGIFTTKA